MDDAAELREVDEAVLDVVVGEVYHLLLHGVQTQHLHGVHQILVKVIDISQHIIKVARHLGQDGGLSEAGLEAPEDPGDGVHLVVGEPLQRGAEADARGRARPPHLLSEDGNTREDV